MTIGLDVGDKQCHLVVLDTTTGDLVEDGKVPTTERAIRRKFERLETVRIALEAGTHSRWISVLLQALGHEVLVANPRKLKLITENDRKSDKLDAELLARVARVDAKLLYPVRHRSAKAQADLALIRARHVLVRQQTQLRNHYRGIAKSFGVRVTGSVKRFHKTEALPKDLRAALSPIVRHIEGLALTIKKLDGQVKKLVKAKYPEAGRLEQVTGVGPLTALAFVLTIEDPHRFKSSRAVGSYFGLRPRQADSGESEPQLRITKAGDGYMRQLLVQCAHYVLGPFGPDSDMRAWGLELAKRGGKNAKKRAVVAVARKLAVLLHRLWVTGEDYMPHRKPALKACG